MSDDEGPRGKGKKGGKGGGKSGKSGQSGGKAGGKSGSGVSVSRLQVLPKFLQDIHARFRPSDETWTFKKLFFLLKPNEPRTSAA